MTLEEKKQKARERVAAWRAADPARSAASVLRSKAKNPEKYRELQRAYHADPKNREVSRKRQREQRAANPDRDNGYTRKWVAANREFRRQVANNWRKRNPEKVNAVYAKRRAAKLNAAPAWANEFFISEAYHLAKLRSKITGFKWHVDHIVPLISKTVCGLHVEHNLRVIPGSINQSKNNRHWPDMP